MVRFHEGIGTLVVIAFLVLTVVYILQLTGRKITWSREASFAAAGLLLFQYVLGFGLLSGSHHVSAWHYIIALSALIPVGLEHAMANAERDPASRMRIVAAAAAATTALVIIAYAIGQSTGS
jgi:heme A synthase